MNDFFENDKALVVFVILVFGCIALGMRIEGSMALIEKMAYGLFGLVSGKALVQK